MLLTPEQQELIVTRLRQLGEKERTCLLCHDTVWFLSDRTFGMRETGGPLSWACLATYPLIVVACAGCGHVELFSAIALGIDMGKSSE